MPAQALGGGLVTGASFVHLPLFQVHVSAVGDAGWVSPVGNSVGQYQVPKTTKLPRAVSNAMPAPTSRGAAAALRASAAVVATADGRGEDVTWSPGAQPIITKPMAATRRRISAKRARDAVVTHSPVCATTTAPFSGQSAIAAASIRVFLSRRAWC